MSDNVEALLQVLRHFDEPAALAEIKAKLDINVSERTVSRWLAQLVESGHIQASGENRGRRYFLPAYRQGAVANSGDYPPFSVGALIHINRIRQPLITRSPCTYSLEWFDNYVPNETFYLNKSQREQLMQQGRQVSAELPAGTYAHQIFNRLLIDLSYNSSRLEGNTYSLPDTRKLLLEGLEADDKLDAEKVMLLNHKDAIRFLVDGINRMEISVDNIRSMHYLLANELVIQGSAGQVRSDSVRVSSTTYVPMDNQQRLEKQLFRIAEKARQIKNPFEQSFFLLVHISYLQAFIDVNKRTARLSCNIPLVRHNLVPLSFNDIVQDDYASAMIVIYEQNEVMPLAELYVWSYLRSCKLYSVTAEAMGIDVLRVQYRQARRDLIRGIVQQSLQGDRMDEYAQEQVAIHIPEMHQEKFMADLRFDIANLAPFNIAGVGISREELEFWLQG